jgi:hypothetical protein
MEVLKEIGVAEVYCLPMAALPLFSRGKVGAPALSGFK